MHHLSVNAPKKVLIVAMFHYKLKCPLSMEWFPVKTGTVKTGTVKTGTVKTGTVKTGTVKTGTVKTCKSTVKTGSQNTDSQTGTVKNYKNQMLKIHTSLAKA
jgi:hypothetical protein